MELGLMRAPLRRESDAGTAGRILILVRPRDWLWTMAATGHEDQSPPPELSVRCRLDKATLLGTRISGRDALIPHLPAPATKPRGTTLSGSFLAVRHPQPREIGPGGGPATGLLASQKGYCQRSPARANRNRLVLAFGRVKHWIEIGVHTVWPVSDACCVRVATHNRIMLWSPSCACRSLAGKRKGWGLPGTG